jgi:hypothetical protein
MGEEASVSWFNDNIHLSTLGHRHLAGLICDQISR